MDIWQVVSILVEKGSSERTARELIWRLVEEEKVKINDQWQIEKM